MSIVRWNSARELATFPGDVFSMQREINKMFDNFFRGGAVDDGSLEASLWSPAVDVAERDDEFQVKVELPGVSKDDVKITICRISEASGAQGLGTGQSAPRPEGDRRRAHSGRHR